MPKLKTHTGAKKRFKLTKNGKVKRAHAYKSHLLNGHGKTAKSKRRLAPRRLRRQDQRGDDQAARSLQIIGIRRR